MGQALNACERDGSLTLSDRGPGLASITGMLVIRLNATLA